MKLEEPTKEHINEVLNKYKEAYLSESDRTLSLIFRTFPKNNNRYEILAKVSILNQLYSTNIFDPYTVAKHIHSLSIDKDLSNGVKNIVEKIANVKFKSTKRYLYSFATKYCSWHYPEKYFMYDRYVESILWEYKKQFKFYNYRRSEIKNYEKFSTVYTNFVHFFGLECFSKKNLDEFLWLESKRFRGKI
jgi:hypothetical protein